MTSINENSTIDDVAGRLFDGILAATDIFTVYLGERLGLYRALADQGAQTSDALAAATGVLPRYAQEWCEAQAAGGWISCSDVAPTATERRYVLSPALAEAMLDGDSLAYLAPVIRMIAAAGGALPALVDTYRGERTFGWDDFGADMREGQAGANRPIFRALLADDWLRRVPDVHQRVAAPGARVAEVGCGLGWAGISLARAFPELMVDGYDVDAPSVQAAQRNAAREGVADRVRFHRVDVGDGTTSQGYDLVLACECIHDMSRPVDVLRIMRTMAAPDGDVVVIDERTADVFAPDAPPMERLLYNFSVLVCLPDGMSDQPSAGTGTVMRASTLAHYATQAGFTRTEVVDLEHDQFRLYRLHG
jgi:2-polyprenyl-3-methyl-5-hydroxy-6-metoxy-1,4-benzoquinol methylase